MTDAPDLKPCPFCGGEAMRKFIGSDRTKTRKVEIACSTFGCFSRQVVGALQYDHQWCDEKATEKWNRRVRSSEACSGEQE